MTELPKRIAELTELLEEPEWNEQNIDKIHKDLNIPIPDSETANKYLGTNQMNHFFLFNNKLILAICIFSLIAL